MCGEHLYLFNGLPGTLVPNATNEMATTLSDKPTVQPKCDARSPINMVKMPIQMIETTKHAQPLQMSVGGTVAKRTFQNKVK